MFESASQLGLFEGVNQRLTWKQKLWTIGAYWGIDQEPWFFDEFGDIPMALDLYQVSNRLEEEVEALQAAKSAARSLAEFVRPTAERNLSLYPDLYSSPCPSPYPAEDLSVLNYDLTQAHENILRDVEETIRRQGPDTTSPLLPYQSSQEDPTLKLLKAPA